MPLSIEVSKKELERIAGLAYEGRVLQVMLCEAGITGYTAESSVADWQSAELSGNGYIRYSTSIPSGSYDAVDTRYEIPPILASFTATGSGYSFDRIIIYIDGETYIHSMIAESTNATILAGQTQTYSIQLSTDN